MSEYPKLKHQWSDSDDVAWRIVEVNEGATYTEHSRQDFMGAMCWAVPDQWQRTAAFEDRIASLEASLSASRARVAELDALAKESLAVNREFARETTQDDSACPKCGGSLYRTSAFYCVCDSPLPSSPQPVASGLPSAAEIEARMHTAFDCSWTIKDSALELHRWLLSRLTARERPSTPHRDDVAQMIHNWLHPSAPGQHPSELIRNTAQAVLSLFPAPAADANREAAALDAIEAAYRDRFECSLENAVMTALRSTGRLAATEPT